MNKKSRLLLKLTAKVIFIIGLSLIILGTTFLFNPMEGSSRVSIFISFILVLAGSFCAVFAAKLNKHPAYLFFGTFFLLAGIFLFLSALGIIPLSIVQGWPLLSVFSGLALLSASWRRNAGFSPRYFVVSMAFVLLGLFLLVFSLDVVTFSFMEFIQVWWPLLFLISGLTLVLISVSVKNFQNSTGNDQNMDNNISIDKQE